MRIAHGMRKLGHFISPDKLPPISLHPFPWRDTHPYYYLLYPLSDTDGRGGYARENHFDAAGIPHAWDAGAPHYDPLVIARYAMRMLAIGASSGRAGPIAEAQRQLEPLLESGEATGAWGRARYSRAMSTERPSCLVQGVAISAMLRLCVGRPSKRVARVLERAFERLAAPISEGGTLTQLGEGPFLEEYPEQPPSHVLNGCIYALFGLYDLTDVLGHTRAGELARSLEVSLAVAINRFSTVLGWSRYALNLSGRAPLASMHYHRMHVLCLRVLAARTGMSAFTLQADRWERAISSVGVRMPIAVVKVAEVMWMRHAQRHSLAKD